MSLVKELVKTFANALSDYRNLSAEQLGLDRTLKDLAKDLPDLSRGLTSGRH